MRGVIVDQSMYCEFARQFETQEQPVSEFAQEFIATVMTAEENDEFLKALEEDDSSLWDEDDVFGAELHRIARTCIENNWHQPDSKNGGWHYFTHKELSELNQRTGNKFDGGYCFLDEDGGKEGLIRLEEGHTINPKWSFDGGMKISIA
jgi:hypothetical protein